MFKVTSTNPDNFMTTTTTKQQQHHLNESTQFFRHKLLHVSTNNAKMDKNSADNAGLLNPHYQQRNNTSTQQQSEKMKSHDRRHHERSVNNLSPSLLKKPTSQERRPSVLAISSICHHLPATSSGSDEDSSMDEISQSHHGDTESSPRFNNNASSSTPATSPSPSPHDIDVDDRDQPYNSNGVNYADLDNTFRGHQQQPPPQPSFSLQTDSSLSIINKRQRMSEDHSANNKIVLPPIRSFASVPNLRSHGLSSFGLHNNDHSQKSWNPLEQLAVITEAYQSTDAAKARFISQDSQSSPSSLDQEREHLLRRSSFDTSQMKYSPITPSALSPYARLPPPSSSSSFPDQRRHSDSPASLVKNFEDRSRVASTGYQQNGYQQQSSSPYPYAQHSSGPYNGSCGSSTSHGYSNNPSHPYSTPHHAQLAHHLTSPYHDPSNANGATMIKAKRKRANANQLKVLNQVFQHTFFPSTELRIQLGKQLGMSPRTVQIWFQNKRQSWRSKTRSTNNPGAEDQAGNLDSPGDCMNETDNSVANNGDHLSPRRSNNSSTSESEEDDRSVPDSPIEHTYSRNNNDNDYFSRSHHLSSSVDSASTPPVPYLQRGGPPHHHSAIHRNDDYFRGGQAAGAVPSSSSSSMTTSTTLPSLTQHSHLKHAYSSTTGNNERLPSIASSFAYSQSHANVNQPFDAFSNSRLPAPTPDNANVSRHHNYRHHHHNHHRSLPECSSMVNTGV